MSKMKLMNSGYKVQRPCAVCQGEGVIILDRCPECGQAVTADMDWWQEERLLCGHEATAVQIDCEVCEGRGSVAYILTEEEYQQLRRKKIIRGIFLLLLGLLPFILLLIAIISRDPDLLFGSPWY